MQIFATDMNLMVNKQLNSTIFSYSYSSKISRAQNVSYVADKIDDAVNHKELMSSIVHGSLMALIALLIIPLWILLGRRL